MSHSPKTIPFAHIHRLLTDRTPGEWESYWTACLPIKKEDFSFLELVQGLINHIRIIKAKRVLLIPEDRRLFLAGFLAALTAGVSVVLPPSRAAKALEDLQQPSDMILTDELPFLEKTSSIFVAKIDPIQAKIIFFTSGSTGEPKEIVKSLLQLQTEIACLEELWGRQTGSCRFLSTVPHHHIYGLLFSLLWPVSAGYPISLQTIHFWEELVNVYIPGDVLISSPSHLGRISLSLEELRPLALHQIFSSGAPLSFIAAQQSRKHLGALPTEILGSTETGGIAYRQQYCEDTPWIPFPMMRISQNKNDCLSLVSPYLLNNKEFQTQDRIILRDDQTFTLLGRADRLVKIEGKRISLDEIEKNIIALNEISQARLVPFLRSDNHSFHKDELAAVVVLSALGIEILENKGKTQLGIHLRHQLKTTCEPLVIPRRWRFVSEIPVTNHGKMSLQVLQSLFSKD